MKILCWNTVSDQDVLRFVKGNALSHHCLELIIIIVWNRDTIVWNRDTKSPVWITRLEQGYYWKTVW